MGAARRVAACGVAEAEGVAGRPFGGGTARPRKRTIGARATSPGRRTRGYDVARSRSAGARPRSRSGSRAPQHVDLLFELLLFPFTNLRSAHGYPTVTIGPAYTNVSIKRQSTNRETF